MLRVKTIGTKAPSRPPRQWHRFIAVDPGTFASAYVIVGFFEGSRRLFVFAKDKVANEGLVRVIKQAEFDFVVCEEIQSYGMRVSTEIFDTVRFTGRIEQICADRQKDFHRLGRRDIKTFLGLHVKCNDGDVRRRLIELYGEPGKPSAPGPTFGFAADMWAALGVAHALLALHNIKQGYK